MCKWFNIELIIKFTIPKNPNTGTKIPPVTVATAAPMPSPAVNPSFVNINPAIFSMVGLLKYPSPAHKVAVLSYYLIFLTVSIYFSPFAWTAKNNVYNILLYYISLVCPSL